MQPKRHAERKHEPPTHPAHRAKSGCAQVPQPAVRLEKASESSTWRQNTAKPVPPALTKYQDKYRMNQSMIDYSKNMQ
jgi:hypothetical protein